MRERGTEKEGEGERGDFGLFNPLSFNIIILK